MLVLIVATSGEREIILCGFDNDNFMVCDHCSFFQFGGLCEPLLYSSPLCCA